ncbi:hypothetical protein GT020_17765 [Glutamicibacter soli]|uniref:Uncharacterized protein n=1 Tax=Glutamicibacter soli TaxID=453836 RepID=A0A6L9G751_9MICC|nr:hypothetical protein [Glutamicibacter soli]NAZ17892.1 hypothetical protein [Glutamicibacter soli]
MAGKMDEFLPGMAGAPDPENKLAIAAEKYIEALQSMDLIQSHHVLKVELVRGLATVAGKAASKGQAAAMAMASAQLREAMDDLPQPMEGDEFSKLMEELKRTPQTEDTH